ncbi:MAG: DNA-binding response regulator [Flavobacteriales bacterium TMED288]|nr:DNA-binding response regulator [Flavobacteriales bacterium]RPG53834.1 MAG: DNA-binding response regulator [Flavobacteriales bacterium TMED288]|tara:strand:- start:11 stop:700 length:690 start_codon:yes stop_codon:yes gene_type:complete
MNQSNKILLIDDDKDVLEFLSYNLIKVGYQVNICLSSSEAIEQINLFKPDLIILDIVMNGIDGIELCEMIRSKNIFNHILIVFFSVRTEDYSKIAALEAGADDYIVKPIKPRFLISKIKSLMRRKIVQKDISNNFIQIGTFSIDSETFKVNFDGLTYSLSKKEFEILYLLASKPIKVFTRNQIFDLIWGNNELVSKRTIDVHIRKIREKISQNLIETVKGVGYRFKYKR